MKNQEELNKSMDTLIDEFFAEDTVEKSKSAMDEIQTPDTKSSAMPDGSSAGPSETTADGSEVKKPKKSDMSKMPEGSSAGPAETEADQVKVAKAPKDAKSKGRPEETSDVPEEDQDGERAKGYEAIQSEQTQTPAISKKGTFVKSEKIEISTEDFELLQKAKRAQEEETIRKAKQEQTDLIKSAVIEATKAIKDENAALKKSLDETAALVKAIARKPQPAKAITSIQALEKSFSNGEESPKSTYFSKSDMLDAAESLIKSKQVTMEQVIELENTGTIYDPAAKAAVERALRNRE